MCCGHDVTMRWNLLRCKLSFESQEHLSRYVFVPLAQIRLSLAKFWMHSGGLSI